MAEEERKVGSIRTFFQRLEKAGEKNPGVLYFRGHSKASYKLAPSVYRNSGWIGNEATMLKELILRCPNDFSDRMSTFECLVKMQHYALPTRLLDITSNPLVALYFACSTHDKDDEDGEVIVLGFGIDKVKYFDSDTANVLSNLSRRSIGFKAPETTEVDEFNDDDEVKLLLHDVRKDRPHFEPKIQPGDISRVVCVKPKLDNPRIIRQDGAFLLFGIDGDKTRPASLPRQSIIERIPINRDKKKEISIQLAALGISKATLFPEIEQVATHIKDSYFIPRLKLSDLSELQRSVFIHLQNGQTKPIRDIASEIGVVASSVSTAISKLLEMGVVERIGSGRDVAWRVKTSIEVV